jgi:hypothetical protein
LGLFHCAKLQSQDFEHNTWIVKKKGESLLFLETSDADGDTTPKLGTALWGLLTSSFDMEPVSVNVQIADVQDEGAGEDRGRKKKDDVKEEVESEVKDELSDEVKYELSDGEAAGVKYEDDELRDGEAAGVKYEGVPDEVLFDEEFLPVDS